MKAHPKTDALDVNVNCLHFRRENAGPSIRAAIAPDTGAVKFVRGASSGRQTYELNTTVSSLRLRELVGGWRHSALTDSIALRASPARLALPLLLLLQLLQHVDAVLVLGVQLDGLGVVLDCQVLLARLHVGFAEAVVGVR